MQGEKLCWHQRPVLMAITEEKVTISALVPAMVTVCMEMLEYDEDYDMELVGDFITLTLLEVCQQKGGNFADRAKAIQQRLTEDLEHSTYSAVEFERELKKRTGDMQGVIMPVVFTSGLGIEQWNEGKWLGKLTYNISQTPQVWLDH